MRLEKSDFDCIFIDSAGGAPSRSQRQKLADVWKNETQPKIALLTSSALAMAAMTAINLLVEGVDIKPFRSKLVDSAFRYLELPPHEEKALAEMRLKLLGELGALEAADSLF